MATKHTDNTSLENDDLPFVEMSNERLVIETSEDFRKSSYLPPVKHLHRLPDRPKIEACTETQQQTYY